MCYLHYEELRLYYYYTTTILNYLLYLHDEELRLLVAVGSAVLDHNRAEDLDEHLARVLGVGLGFRWGWG